MLKGEAFAIRCGGEGFNCLTQAESRECHLVGVELSESQTPGFPEMPHRWRIESQQPRTHDISGQRVRTGNHEARLDGMAA